MPAAYLLLQLPPIRRVVEHVVAVRVPPPCASVKVSSATPPLYDVRVLFGASKTNFTRSFVMKVFFTHSFFPVL
jgi:hypothetical protein